MTFDVNVILNLSNISYITRVTCWSERREWDRTRAYMHSGLLRPCALANSFYAEVVLKFRLPKLLNSYTCNNQSNHGLNLFSYRAFHYVTCTESNEHWLRNAETFEKSF